MYLNDTKHQGWTVFASSLTCKYFDWQIWTFEQGALNKMVRDCKQPAFDTFFMAQLSMEQEKKKKRRKTLTILCLCDSKLPHFQSHHLSIGHTLDWLWTLNIYYKVISETFLIQISIVNPVLIILISLVTCNSKVTPKTSFWDCACKSNSFFLFIGGNNSLFFEVIWIQFCCKPKDDSSAPPTV